MRQKSWYLKLFFIVFFSLSLFKIAFAGVPIPWGAKLIRDDVAITGNGEERKIASYETKASKQELFNYYQREMSNRGYNLFMNGQQNLVFNKGEELVVVAAPPSRDGKTQFMISIDSMKSAMSNPSVKENNCEPIPSVPVYPGARCMNSTRLKSGGSSSASYSADDTITAVIDFYYLQLPRYGWQFEKEINLEEIMSKAMPGQQIAMTPEQQTAMNNFYGSARALSFVNQKGNGCSVHVMNNPIAKGGALINIVYEDKTRKQ